jgi:hypothetical protein
MEGNISVMNVDLMDVGALLHSRIKAVKHGMA